MKLHQKRKNYRLAIKRLAKQGMINRPDGLMVAKAQCVDNSMRRDYSPQGSN